MIIGPLNHYHNLTLRLVGGKEIPQLGQGPSDSSFVNL